jgi:hypothetical protein
VRVKVQVTSLRIFSVSITSTGAAGLWVAVMLVLPCGSVAEAPTDTCTLLPWKSAMVADCVRLHVMLVPESIVLPNAGEHATVAGLAENVGVSSVTVPVLVRVTALAQERSLPAGREQQRQTVIAPTRCHKLC